MLPGDHCWCYYHLIQVQSLQPMWRSGCIDLIYRKGTRVVIAKITIRATCTSREAWALLTGNAHLNFRDLRRVVQWFLKSRENCNNGTYDWDLHAAMAYCNEILSLAVQKILFIFSNSLTLRHLHVMAWSNIEWSLFVRWSSNIAHHCIQHGHDRRKYRD